MTYTLKTNGEPEGKRFAFRVLRSDGKVSPWYSGFGGYTWYIRLLPLEEEQKQFIKTKIPFDDGTTM